MDENAWIESPRFCFCVHKICSYDVLGNIVSVAQGTELTSYQYNAYGEKFKVTYPDGSEQTYSYDGAWQICRGFIFGERKKIVKKELNIVKKNAFIMIAFFHLKFSRIHENDSTWIHVGLMVIYNHLKEEVIGIYAYWIESVELNVKDFFFFVS